MAEVKIGGINLWRKRETRGPVTLSEVSREITWAAFDRMLLSRVGVVKRWSR